jgi:hypothetical protein
MNKLDRGGRSLREILDELAPLPTEQSIAIGAQVAYELAHAHDRGFVHRAVRPANIIVYRDPLNGHGFGTARLCATTAPSAAETDALHYESPEQKRGETEIDGRTDVFALGVVLYEMLTGKLPDRAAEPQLPSELNPNVPFEVDGLVLGMLAKERDDRLPSAIVAGHALHRIDRQIRGEVAREPVPLPAEPARVAVDRLLRASTSITVAAVIVGLLGGLVYFGGSDGSPKAGAAGEPALAFMTAQQSPDETAVAEQPRITVERPPSEAPAQRSPAEADVTEAPRIEAPRSPTSLTEKPVVARTASASSHPVRSKPTAAVRVKSREKARPPKRETAKVIISVSPWAEIYVNGTRHGTTPPVSVIELSPGKHRIVIRHSSQPPYLAFVNVKAGETRKLRHDFAL